MLLEVNTLAFSAKATLRTKRHAASFKYIYLYSWHVEWKCIKQAGNRRKVLMSIQQACATSVGQKLCCAVHRGDSFHDAKAGVTLLFALCCVCTSLHRDSLVSNLLHSHFRKITRGETKHWKPERNLDGVVNAACRVSVMQL